MDNPSHPSGALPDTLDSAVRLLTERQREILQLVQDGRSNREIADRLAISEGTVKQHLVTIFRQLKVRNRTMAAQLGTLSQQNSPENRTQDPPDAGAEEEASPDAEGEMYYTSALQPVSMVVARVPITEAMVHRLGSAHFGRINRTLQQLCAAAAHRFGGVMQAIPGGFLLLFGVPRMREEDPERATCCACWMERTMAEQQRVSPLRESLSLRVCVLSGEAIASSGGGKTTLYGNMVSHPCLMSPHVCDGVTQPHLSPATRQALWYNTHRYGAVTAFFPEGDALMRAMEPVMEPLPQPPLVGRESELRTLLASAAEAQAGASRTLVIVGEAGFGKSRLVQALRTLLTVGTTWLWLEGQCRTVANRTPWYPFAALLAQLSGCPATWAVSAKAARIEEWLQQHHPEQAESGRRLMAQWTGMAHETVANPIRDPGEPVQQVAALLVAVLSATGRPTVLFLDNLQWADPDTLAVFPHLAKGCNGSPVWLIGATRRSWLRLFPGADLVSTLSLNRLTPKNTVQLLRAIHPTAPGDDEVHRRLAQWSSGVPLFATELGHSALARHRAALARPGTIDPLSLDHRDLLTLFPRTLQGLILERLDAVQVNWRVVRAIAAHGRITWDALLDLGLHARATTTAAVEHLFKVGLLGETGAGGDRTLFFNNEMVRAAIWLTLLDGDRRTDAAHFADDRPKSGETEGATRWPNG